jgi:hypothetical protein
VDAGDKPSDREIDRRSIESPGGKMARFTVHTLGSSREFESLSSIFTRPCCTFASADSCFCGVGARVFTKRMHNLRPALESHQGGAGGRTRTDDLRFTKPLLCQLSYSGGAGQNPADNPGNLHLLPSKQSSETSEAPHEEAGFRLAAPSILVRGRGAALGADRLLRSQAGSMSRPGNPGPRGTDGPGP